MKLELKLTVHEVSISVLPTMSSLRILPRHVTRPLQLRSSRVQPLRPFSSVPPLRLKEDKERSPEEADRIKEEQRQKAAAGKGHWHEELASQSESHVAADRENVKDHRAHMEDLQKQTANETQKKHPDAKR